MMKKILNIITIVFTLLFLYKVIMEKVLVYNSITYSLNIWVNNLIPTLFPFFIISDILINYNVTLYIPNFFRQICKYLFRITDNMISILLLSIISGFPSNARNTRLMYDKEFITLDEANHILIFSHFSNPLFILTTIVFFFSAEKDVGIILLISHYLSNFILGMLFRGYFNHSDAHKEAIKYQVNFGKVLISSIKKSIDTTLLICGIITLFMLLSTIIVDALNLNIYNSMLIKGLFEITGGIEALGKLNIPIIYKNIIASCFLAFGGISVHFQVISQISDTDIKYRYFFVGRVFQTILSGIITYVMCLL